VSEYSESQRHIIPQGLDYANQYLFWEMPELLMGLSCFVVFLLLHELLLGIGLMMICLYGSHRFKSPIRGRLQHLAWYCHLPIAHKGLEFAPPPSVTRFEQ
jgi:hypothetical protein